MQTFIRHNEDRTSRVRPGSAAAVHWIQGVGLSEMLLVVMSVFCLFESSSLIVTFGLTANVMVVIRALCDTAWSVLPNQTVG